MLSLDLMLKLEKYKGLGVIEPERFKRWHLLPWKNLISLLLTPSSVSHCNKQRNRTRLPKMSLNLVLLTWLV